MKTNYLKLIAIILLAALTKGCSDSDVIPPVKLLVSETRSTTIRDSDPTPSVVTTSYEYQDNILVRAVSVYDDESRQDRFVNYYHDDVRRLIRDEVGQIIDGSEEVSRVTSYSYDQDGRQISKSSDDFRSTYEYDDQNRCIKRTDEEFFNDRVKTVLFRWDGENIEWDSVFNDQSPLGIDFNSTFSDVLTPPFSDPSLNIYTGRIRSKNMDLSRTPSRTRPSLTYTREIEMNEFNYPTKTVVYLGNGPVITREYTYIEIE